ncbi:MAG: cobalamin-dependent protein [Alphaproteobacteria bacterium]|nr:cobalamin-dependent protein [Alphaproteobacteria bacterium]
MTSSAPLSQPVFDEAEAEARKEQISRVIKPVSGITALPERQGPVKRVLLIIPPGTMEEHVGRLSGAAGELPMLGLAFIAAALRDQGHEVQLIDYEVNGWPMSRVAQDIADFAPDLIGMTAYITNMRRCASVAVIAKEVNPLITVVLGGPQVTIFPDEAFHSPQIDMVVLSEGEIIVRNLMNALGDEAKLRQVKGIWFRAADGEIVRNEREVLVDNLDIFPAHALDLFEMEKYFPPVYIRGSKVAHLLTSRGCPFKCTFCETKLTFGRSFRYHSTERVLKDLERLIDQGYDGFQFYDDIFTANKKRVFDLCQGILDRGWRIRWMCYTRTNTLSADMLAIMKKAGCYMISFGFETADDDLLKLVNKGLTVAQNIEGIRLTRQAGIQVTGTFMLGLPGETAEQSEKCIQFALDHQVDYAIFGITEPFPGTELWVDAQKYGYFDSSGKYQNALLSEHAAVWVPNGRTREELKNLIEKAMWKFYIRPQPLLQAFKNFYCLPFRRAVRYLWSGVVFFIGGRLNKSHLAQRN